METNKSCSFFGHRDTQATEELQQTIRETVEYLITQRQVDTFLFGSRSNFNDLCHLVVSQLKEKYPHIQRIAYTCKSETCVLESEREKWEKLYSIIDEKEKCLLCVEKEVEHKTKYTAGRASYVERNYAMINDSHYCIFYYQENYKPKTTNGYQAKSGTAIAFA